MEILTRQKNEKTNLLLKPGKGEKAIPLMKKILTNLTFWVLLAIVTGTLLGHYYPALALQPLWEKPVKFSLVLSTFEIKPSLS